MQFSLGMRKNCKYLQEDLNSYNITIQDSIFENDVDLSNLLVKNSVDFSMTNFNGPVSFDGTNFNGPVNFVSTNFDSAGFRSASFNDSAYFNQANFNKAADFGWTIFNGSAYFYQTYFSGYAYFFGIKFNSRAGFLGTNFNGPVYFDATNFNKPADFRGAIFNGSADFEVPDSSNNIYTDGGTCEFFRKRYNDKARYTDADNIYYNFRKISMDGESISISKIIDFLSWLSCGFGTKLDYTIGWIIGIITLFAFVYKWDWKTPGIYRSPEEDKENESKVSFLECLCFSINTFTRLGTPNWRQRDKFWYAVTIEGVLGWIMLAIFLATLMHLLMRP